MDKMKEISIYVDGSYTVDNPGVAGWGWIAMDGNRKVASGDGALSGLVVSMRQVGGEMKAAMEAVKWAVGKYDSVVIMYDYEGVRSWALGDWRAKNEWTRAYVGWINGLGSAIKLSFEKIDASANLADEYARRATGAPSAH